MERLLVVWLYAISSVHYIGNRTFQDLEQSAGGREGINKQWCSGGGTRGNVVPPNRNGTRGNVEAVRFPQMTTTKKIILYKKRINNRNNYNAG